MGESVEDRAGMLVALSTLNPQPESVPINALVPVEGTDGRSKTGRDMGND
jgi:biotin synthase